MWTPRRWMASRRPPFVFIKFLARIQASYRAKEHVLDSMRGRNLKRPPAARKSLVIWIRSNCFVTRPSAFSFILNLWIGEKVNFLRKAGYSKCGQVEAKCCQFVEPYCTYRLRLSD